MDADAETAVLGDLVARERRHKGPLVYGTGSQPYTAHKFCTDAWKSANLFRYHGVGPGRDVCVADDPRPPALLALFGATLQGAAVRFGLDGNASARLLVGSPAALADAATEPGTKRVAFGAPPEDPDVVHFERDIWSENPTMPPDRVDPAATALATADSAYSHADLLEATDCIVENLALSDEDAVALRASLTDPGAVVAGVLAPLSVGATLVLPGADRTGTVAVTANGAPEPRTVDPGTVPLPD